MNDDEKIYLPKQLEIIKKVGKISKTIDNQTGNNQTGNNQTGNNQTGNNQTGNNQTGNNQTGNNQTGNNQTGNNQTGNNQTGNNQTGNNQTGNNQTGNNQTGNNQTGNNQTGNNQTGNNQTGINQKIKKKFPLNIIFLPDKYNNKKTKWNMSIRKKKSLIKNLELLGVKVYFNNDINDFVFNKVFTFNDNNFPIINTLYIHLFNGAYYCDKQFTSKKIEKEREMIFLLAGKLGVSEIKYKITSSNISINGIDASLNVDKFKLGGTFNKKIINSDEKEYKEKYSNRGAPVYILCKNLEQVEENIKYKLGNINPKVFSYKFYKDNRKLTTFVFKRFNFKMIFLNYTSETEDIYDRTIEIKILLMSNGLGIKINNYMYTMQKISYEMVFFSDQELRLELDKIIQLDEDPFYQTREIYDSIGNKNIAVFSITKYVREFSKSIKYKIINTEDEMNFGIKLNEWVDNNSDDFLATCHTFTNTYQIEVWLLSVLKLNENEELIESEKKSYNISGINEIKKNNYEIYKKRLLEYDDYKNNDEEEEYDLYYCEMNQSNLNIAKLEKKIEDQNKILKEKKENIKELEKKNNTSDIKKQVEKLQNELKLKKKENDKIKEKLKRLEYNNSNKVQNSPDHEYYLKIIQYINLIDKIKRNNYYNIWKIETLINDFEGRRSYYYKKIKNKEIHDYKMYFLDYKKLFMEIKKNDIDNKIMDIY